MITSAFIRNCVICTCVVKINQYLIFKNWTPSERSTLAIFTVRIIFKADSIITDEKKRDRKILK